MELLAVAVTVAAPAMGFLWLLRRELDKLPDPHFLRSHGVVVVREEILQEHSPAIGSYQGRSIWGSVTFMGLVYCFDHVLPASRKERLAPGELYLEPGLVYVTGRPRPGLPPRA